MALSIRVNFDVQLLPYKSIVVDLSAEVERLKVAEGVSKLKNTRF